MSGELQQIVVTSPNPVAPTGHEAAMIAVVDAKAAAVLDRPEWLPEKFKTVEEMAASYKELEGKLGAGTPPVAAVVPPAAAAVVPVTPNPAAMKVPAADAAGAAVVAAGLDMAALNAEFASAGTLSEASMASLAKAGFDQKTVDNYIAGQQALMTQFQAEVTAVTPGGAEKYGDMMAWAKSNLSAAEADAYNAVMTSGSKEQAKLAVAGLGARFTTAIGSEPPLSGGRTPSAVGDVFESLAEMKVAMSDPRYSTDPAYRSKVAQKLGRSSIL